MARPSPKVLRIASLIDGLVCDELHQSSAESVTAGADVSNQLLLFGPYVPRSHGLFVVQDGRYVLVLPPRSGGQLVMKGKAIKIADLWRKQLRADPKAQSLRLQLDPSARGKLDLGETTLLCFFKESTDICNAIPDGKPKTGYTKGTLVIVAQGLKARTLNPTDIVSNAPSNVQRLFLVR